MTISRDDVLKVALLARLDIDEEDVDMFAGQIADILDYVDQLKAVNTEGIEGTAHATERINAFREDEPAGHLDREAALDNAPERDEGAFVVPKVIE